MRYLLGAALVFNLIFIGNGFAEVNKTTQGMKTTETSPTNLTSETTATPMTSTKATTTSKVEDHKQAARLWYEEVIVKKNTQPLDQVLADEVVVEYAPTFKSPITHTNKLQGISQVKQHISKVNEQADFSGPIIYLIGDGDQVALYRVVTQKDHNGKSTNVPWASFFEFNADGKINKITHVHDTAAAQMLASNNIQKTTID